MFNSMRAHSLRQHMIEDMNMRGLARSPQFDYVRHVARFARRVAEAKPTAWLDGAPKRQLCCVTSFARASIAEFSEIDAEFL